ncbi:GntR family transcriptional regulator [Streptomyces sp. KL116D]|uniref:GntR family transcriptional regulator n=1 Tax=Streptomyces sp. KL116D TaxID=3045152 RepID=UPI0035570190
MPESDERTALYRLYDEDDRLLYVGISSEPKKRMKAHAADKPWWPEVATRDFEWFDTRAEAADAEVETIRREQPAYNHTHNTAAVLALLPAVDEEPLRPRPVAVAADNRSVAERMAADIRPVIMAGDMPVGSRFPSTQDLITQFRTSNVTVQRGLRILKDEGFAVGRSGSAVYVTSPAPQHLDDPSQHVETEVASEEVTPPRRVAQALAIEDGDLVQRVDTLVQSDGRPIRMVSTYQRLHGAGGVPAETLDQISVRPPTTAELLALQLSQEVPVMQVFRQVLDGDGHALEVQSFVEPGNLCLRQYRTPFPQDVGEEPRD